MLGSGTSHGVPMIGCDCAVCHSTDPRDRRIAAVDPHRSHEHGDVTRIAIRARSAHILVDTSTDLREQALTHNLRRVDAILFTHSHADHVLGLDEVRRSTCCSARHSRATLTRGRSTISTAPSPTSSSPWRRRAAAFRS